MLRPYYTVIKDSFHEAFASRVLWILLVFLTLLLLAAAPLGLSEQKATKLHLEGVSDWPGLITKIKQQSEETAPSPGKRIWELSSDKFKEAVNDATEEEGPPEVSRRTARTLLNGLNDLLARHDFHDAAAWANLDVDAETTEQIDKGLDSLPEDELIHVNRQLFKAAFPAEVANLSNEELQVSYLVWDVGTPIPVSRDMVEPIINQAIGGIMSFFVGTLAVFVAILVTSPIIPHMFDAGAIDLLLSKPVVRSWLFLAKFLGGCAFIVLAAGYFIVGLWLIVGLRFGLWNNAILMCIPLFFFLFSIYYSVSALAAVRWKNAIVSVVITILFWFACFFVGTAKHVVESIFLRPNALVSVVAADDALIAANRAGEFFEWQTDHWERIAERDSQQGPPFGMSRVLLGPVFVPGSEEFLYIQQPPDHHFSFMSPRATLTKMAFADGAWQQTTGPAPPRGASWLFLGPDGDVLVVATSGVYRLEQTDSAEEEKKKPSILGITLPFGGADDPYVPLGPKENLALGTPFSAAIDPASGDIVVYGKGKLIYLNRNDKGLYERGAQREFEDTEGQATLALAGGTVVLVQSDGEALLLDAKTLDTRKPFRPSSKGEPYMIVASRDGSHFALLMHNGRLVVFDAQGAGVSAVDNDVSAVGFDDKGHLLVADRNTRVRRYAIDTLAVAGECQPNLEIIERVYRYFLLPFYTVFPKPGELDNVIHYLLTDQDTVTHGPSATTDLRQTRIAIDVWGPIWSSLAFVVVVLGLTCVYIQRMDF